MTAWRCVSDTERIGKVSAKISSVLPLVVPASGVSNRVRNQLINDSARWRTSNRSRHALYLLRAVIQSFVAAHTNIGGSPNVRGIAKTAPTSKQESYMPDLALPRTSADLDPYHATKASQAAINDSPPRPAAQGHSKAGPGGVPQFDGLPQLQKQLSTTKVPANARAIRAQSPAAQTRNALKLDVQRGETAEHLPLEQLRSIAAHAVPAALLQHASDSEVLALCYNSVLEMTAQFMTMREGKSGYRMATEPKLPGTKGFTSVDREQWTEALGFDLFEQEIDGKKLDRNDRVFKNLSMLQRDDGTVSFYKGPSDIMSSSDRTEYIHFANNEASQEMKSMALLGKILALHVKQGGLKFDSCVGFSMGGAQLHVMAIAANANLPHDKRISVLSIDAPMLNTEQIALADPHGNVSGQPHGLNFVFVTDESDKNLYSKMNHISGRRLDEHIGTVRAKAAQWLLGVNPTVAKFESPGTCTIQLFVDKQVDAVKAEITAKGTHFAVEKTPEFSAGIFGNHPRGQQLPQALWAVLNYFAPADARLTLDQSGAVVKVSPGSQQA